MPVDQLGFEDAVSLQQRGRLLEAERVLQSVLQTDPRHFEAAYRLGLICLQRGLAERSEGHLAYALQIDPSSAAAHFNRGLAFRALRRHGAAVTCHDRAIALEPDYVEAHFHRALTLKALKRTQEAIASFDRAIALKPDHAAAHFQRGNLFLKDQRADVALASYDTALTHDPTHVLAHNNRANALRVLDRVEDAVAGYDKAIGLKPDFAVAHCNRAQALQDMGRFDEAIASYDRAIALQPGLYEAHKGRGTLRLLLGDMPRGFAEFEYRSPPEDIALRLSNYPAWSGQSLAGRSILVYSDGAFGDLVQFCRYLPLLAAQAAQITLLLPERFHRILAPGLAGVKLVASIDNLDGIDYRCELMSLPFQFKTDLTNIPPRLNLFRPSSSTAAAAKLSRVAFNVGICWQGNPTRNIDRGRSIPLVAFQPLSQISGVCLFSLQKIHGLDQLSDLPPDMQIETSGPDFDAGPDAFVDTADAIAALDLVITSDTAVAHLAATLGCATWIALKLVPEWRWLLGRSDSPWYPTVRLFRQRELNRWEPVLDEIATALRDVVATTGSFAHQGSA